MASDIFQVLNATSLTVKNNLPQPNEFMLRGPDDMMRSLTQFHNDTFILKTGIEDIQVRLIQDYRKQEYIVFEEIQDNNIHRYPRRFEFLKRLITHCFQEIGHDVRKPVVRFTYDENHRGCEITLSVLPREYES